MGTNLGVHRLADAFFTRNASNETKAPQQQGEGKRSRSQNTALSSCFGNSIAITIARAIAIFRAVLESIPAIHL